jgi:hypothetical protein
LRRHRGATQGFGVLDRDFKSRRDMSLISSKSAPNRREQKRRKSGGSSNSLSAKRRMHALLERDAEQLIRKLIDKALDGDAACLKLCIERLCPPYKPAPVPSEHDDEKQYKTRVIDQSRRQVTGCAPLRPGGRAE